MGRPHYLGPQSLGEALQLLRRRTGVSRNDLAPLVQLSPGALANYENDVSVPSAVALRRLTWVIAERLDCEVSELWEQLGEVLDGTSEAPAPDLDELDRSS